MQLDVVSAGAADQDRVSRRYQFIGDEDLRIQRQECARRSGAQASDDILAVIMELPALAASAIGFQHRGIAAADELQDPLTQQDRSKADAAGDADPGQSKSQELGTCRR